MQVQARVIRRQSRVVIEPTIAHGQHSAEYDEALQLEVGNGLGDILVAFPVAYRLTELGRPAVPVPIAPRTDWPWPVSNVWPSALPYLPLCGPVQPEAERLALHGPRIQWWAEGPPLPVELMALAGVEPGTTPLTALLREPARPATAPDEPYILIAPEGHFYADYKRMSAAQVAAIVEVASASRLRTVAVHSGPLHMPKGVVNLTGRTDIPTLCGLVAHAEVVVSTDCGVLHLAGGYQKPLLGLLSRHTLHPSRVAHYMPAAFLSAEQVGQIDTTLVRGRLKRLLDAAAVTVAHCVRERCPCGVCDTAEAVAAAAGATCGPPEQHHAGPYIAEYHSADDDWWRTTWKETPWPAVLSVHAGLPDAPRRSALVCRSIALWREWQKRGLTHSPLRPVAFVPLPSVDWPARALPARPRVIAWHGILRGDKNLPSLLAAFRRVRQVCPDAELLLVASGDPAVAPQDEPGVKVVFRRTWTREQLQKALSVADVYCYPYTETGPEASAAVAAALGYGRPVVVTSAAKTQDYAGWCVVADCKPVQLASALLRLLTDPVVYACASARAVQGASYRHPRLVARQLQAVARQVLLCGGMP